MNSLGTYIRDEMERRQWALGDLTRWASLDEADLLPLFDPDPLPDLPSSRVIHELADALGVSVQAMVLRCAEACGLPLERESVGATAEGRQGRAGVDDVATALSSVSNEELMRELRRRLALGASTGSYLASKPAAVVSLVSRAQVG